MRIMTIDAVVARARPLGKIPISFHAAMRAVLVIAELRAVTLCAQRHDICELHFALICEPQRVVIARIVTGKTRQRAVVIYQALMKFIECVS